MADTGSIVSGLPPQRARITIVDQHTNIQAKIIAPTGVPIRMLLPALVNQMGLKTVGPSGNIRDYFLAIDGAAHTLGESETLESAGVSDGASLRILSQVHHAPPARQRPQPAKNPPNPNCTLFDSVTRTQLVEAVADAVESRIVSAMIEVVSTVKTNDPTTKVFVEPFFGPALQDEQYICDIYAILPSTTDSTSIYENAVILLAKDLGLKAKRADDLFNIRGTVQTIWSAISGARVVIADCTGRDPKVCYELGIAHTLGKPVILLAHDANADLLPGLQSSGVIEYRDLISGMAILRTRLDSALRSTLGIGVNVPK